MDPKIVVKTQEALGKILTKPPLTAKLLNKPPFRFIHDITTETIRTTGFMKGLFSKKEMDSRLVKERDDKIAFLEKVFKCVSLIHGSQLAVNPIKVVAGQEPEKTNEFMQVMARCARKNVPSAEAVKKVLAGGDDAEPKPARKTKSSADRSPSQKRRSATADKSKEAGEERRSSKEHRDKSKEHRDKSKETGGAEKKKHRSRDRSKDEKEKEKKDGEKEKEKKDGGKERDEKRREEKEKRRRDRDKDRNKSTENGKEKEKSRKSSQEREKSRNREEKAKHGAEDKEKSSSKKSEEKPKRSSDDKDAERRDKEKRREERRKRKAAEAEKAAEKDEKGEKNGKPEPSATEKSERKKSEKHEKESKPAKEEKADDATSAVSSRGQRPASAKGQRRRPQTRAGRNESGARNEMNDQTEQEEQPAPRKLVRPPSARPSAPRVRRNAPGGADEALETSAQEKSAPIIVDRDQNMTLSDEEDAQFVVQEDKTMGDETAADLLPPTLAGEINGEDHGGLVRKILETKKELEGSAANQKFAGAKTRSGTEIQQSKMNSAQQEKERQLVVQEIEQLQASVQKLCQSSAPLAKLIDYSQEDMDTMQTELQVWRKENGEHAVKIKEDNSVTAMSIEPLKAELEELDQAIAVYRTQMAATKVNIIKNDEKIQKMMVAVATRS